MGIYDRWDEFLKMAEEMRGTGATDLRPLPRWWTNIPVYFDAIRYFFSVVFVLFLYVYLFCLWLDVILFLL